MKNNLKIVFIGTPDFGAIILEGLIKNEYSPVLVITEPDKPMGRKQVPTPLPVKVSAEKYNLQISQPANIANCQMQIKELDPDLIIVASYGQIIPKKILDIPKHGCLNVHPSLLPKHRGSSPIQTAILNGDEKTGLTIMLMDEKVDHGSIVAQEETTIETNDTNETLRGKMTERAIALLTKTIPRWVNKEIKAKPQVESLATYTKTLSRENGKIDWDKTSQQIDRLIRAYSPWPGAFTFWQKNDKLMRIKILKAKAVEIDSRAMIGQIVLSPSQKVAVKCKEGFLEIQELQPEGKSPMAAEDFLRGNPQLIQAFFE